MRGVEHWAAPAGDTASLVAELPATDLLVSVIYQDRREGVRDASVATVTGLPFPFPPTLNFNTQLTTDRTDFAFNFFGTSPFRLPLMGAS